MIKAIVFDFDGVIVESNHIKTEAFRKLFSKWKDKVDEIVSFHVQNMGVSRYAKFRYIYENILREPYSEKMGAELGRQFSEVVVDEIKKVSLVKGTKGFLDECYHKYLLFIASATPQEELLGIVQFKGLDKYFNGVFGAPDTKSEIIETLLKEHSLGRHKVVFVGDAESDRVTAETLGIPFIARLTDDTTTLRTSQWTIRDLTELRSIIQEIDDLDR